MSTASKFTLLSATANTGASVSLCVCVLLSALEKVGHCKSSKGPSHYYATQPCLAWSMKTASANHYKLARNSECDGNSLLHSLIKAGSASAQLTMNNDKLRQPRLWDLPMVSALSGV